MTESKRLKVPELLLLSWQPVIAACLKGVSLNSLMGVLSRKWTHKIVICRKW